MSRLTLLTVGVLALSSAAPARAATLVSPAAGFSGTLTSSCFADAGNVEIEIIYNNWQSCSRHGIAEFVLPEATGTSVASAQLVLFNGGLGNFSQGTYIIDLYGYAGDGVVTGADFGAGTFIGSATWLGEPGATFTADVTSFVNGQLGLGVSILGFNMRPPEEGLACCTTRFLYFDGAEGLLPPVLEIIPVPVPSAVILFVAGLVSLPVMGRRRSQ